MIRTPFVHIFIIIAFLVNTFGPLPLAQAQDFSINQLPVPGTMVGTSVPFAPLVLKGLIVNPQKPLEFQFIIDTGRGPQDTASVKEQANQLVKYFLAGLTIPEGDLWVNLSPYEKDRMVPQALGQTDLGRDLLAQDYILKQLTASLIYPERALGKEFWSKVYAKAQEQFGTTNVPVNTFNKVWILPNQAQVYENVNAAYVTKSTLKVMLDEDYLALNKHNVPSPNVGRDREGGATHTIASKIVRQIILPEIEKEVNTGKNFAPLRQIYQALILAKWYKETIQNGLLDAVYTNKNKVAGVNLNDPAIKEQIYERYLKAYKKGTFNYIKEDPTPNGQVVPRKYFSGGIPMQIDLKHDGAMSAVKIVGSLLSVVFLLGAVENSALAQSNTFPQTSSAQTSQYSNTGLPNDTAALFSNFYSPNDQVRYSSVREYISIKRWDKDIIQQLKEQLLNLNNDNQKYRLSLFEAYEGLGGNLDDVIPTIAAFLHSADGNDLSEFLNLLERSAGFRSPEYKVIVPDLIKIVKKDHVGALRRSWFWFRYIFQPRADNPLPLILANVGSGLSGGGGSLDYPSFETKEYSLENLNSDIQETAAGLIKRINGGAEHPLLAKEGANVDTTSAKDSEDAEVGLISASSNGDIHAVEHWLAKNPNVKTVERALIEASGAGRADIVRRLLAVRGIDVNATNDHHETALIKASNGSPAEPMAAERYLDIVHQLLAKGADATIESSIGMTALSTARDSGVDNTPIIKALEGAEVVAGHGSIALTYADKAALAKAPGGIDLNQIDVKRNGKTVNVQFDPAQLTQLEQGGFQGFTPVIINITHISSPFQLLGISPAKQEVLAKA